MFVLQQKTKFRPKAYTVKTKSFDQSFYQGNFVLQKKLCYNLLWKTLLCLVVRIGLSTKFVLRRMLLNTYEISSGHPKSSSYILRNLRRVLRYRNKFACAQSVLWRVSVVFSPRGTFLEQGIVAEQNSDIVENLVKFSGR